MDETNGTMGAKVRNATLKQFNFICVVGNDEQAAGLVDVRQQNGNRLGKFTVGKFVAYLRTLEPKPSPAEMRQEKNAFFNQVIFLPIPLI